MGRSEGTDDLLDVDHALLFARLPTSYLVLTPDLRIADANEAYLTSVQQRREDLLGRFLFEAFPASRGSLDASGVPAVQVSMERALDTGRPDVMPVLEYDVPDGAGGWIERHWSLIHTPVPGPDGTVRYLLQRAEDVTDYVQEREARQIEEATGLEWRRRGEEAEADLYARARQLQDALAAQERTARRLEGLAEAALQLSGAESVDDLRRSVIGRGVLALGGDGGAVAVLVDGGESLELSLTESLGEATRERYARLPTAVRLPACVAATTGERVVLRDRAAGLAWSAEMADVYATTGRSAWASLPLQIGSRLLGSLTVSWEQPQELGDDEVELLAAFAAQCAQALDRLQVREAEQRSAARAKRLSETLQLSLLTEPPEPDHLQIAVRYEPAAQEAQVGGDWYDAFLLPNGSTTLVVGDVTGHDRNAAAAMGQVRNVLRGVAQMVVEPPGVVLSALDRALHNLAVPTLATAVLVQVTQDDAQRAQGLRLLSWSNAGHPPPVLLHADGRAELLAREPDLLLGLQADTDRSHHTLLLPPDTTLLLYTDGLVERRGESLDVGLERLRQTAEGAAHLPVEQLCDLLLRTLTDEREDDVALLVLRLFAEDRPRPYEAGPRTVPAEPLLDPRT